MNKASASGLDPEGVTRMPCILVANQKSETSGDEADTQSCSVRSIYRSIVLLDTCPAVPM